MVFYQAQSAALLRVCRTPRLNGGALDRRVVVFEDDDGEFGADLDIPLPSSLLLLLLLLSPKWLSPINRARRSTAVFLISEVVVVLVSAAAVADCVDSVLSLLVLSSTRL